MPADQTVPDSALQDALDLAAETFDNCWVNGADHQDSLKVAVTAIAPILAAAGRAQAAADLRDIGRRFEADADQLRAEGDQAGADATKQTAMGYWWAANAIVPPHEVARRNAEARIAEESP
jgi:hypothetical protein